MLFNCPVFAPAKVKSHLKHKVSQVHGDEFRRVVGVTLNDLRLRIEPIRTLRNQNEQYQAWPAPYLPYQLKSFAPPQPRKRLPLTKREV